MDGEGNMGDADDDDGDDGENIVDGSSDELVTTRTTTLTLTTKQVS